MDDFLGLGTESFEKLVIVKLRKILHDKRESGDSFKKLGLYLSKNSDGKGLCMHIEINYHRNV